MSKQKLAILSAIGLLLGELLWTIQVIYREVTTPTLQLQAQLHLVRYVATPASDRLSYIDSVYQDHILLWPRNGVILQSTGENFIEDVQNILDSDYPDEYPLLDSSSQAVLHEMLVDIRQDIQVRLQQGTILEVEMISDLIREDASIRMAIIPEYVGFDRYQWLGYDKSLYYLMVSEGQQRHLKVYFASVSDLAEKLMLFSRLAWPGGLLLFTSFSLMCWTSWKYLRQKKQQAAQLERRVEIRTHELRETNEQLIEEIHEREKAEAALEEKLRIETEVKLAAALQQTLFPKKLPNLQELELASYFKSASETGGDWYGFITRIKGYFYILIGDVTGHGVPTALVTATANATCRVLEDMFRAYRATDHLLDPAEILHYLNKAVYQTGHPDYLMTFFAFRLDLHSGLATYANAGHNFPILLRPDGSRKYLVTSGSPLGHSPNQTFSEKVLPLDQGDTLFFYTDGIIENTNPSGDMWGQRKFFQYLRHFRGKSADCILENVIQDAFTFYEKQPIEDDMTLIVCRIRTPFLADPP